MTNGLTLDNGVDRRKEKEREKEKKCPSSTKEKITIHEQRRS